MCGYLTKASFVDRLPLHSCAMVTCRQYSRSDNQPPGDQISVRRILYVNKNILQTAIELEDKQYVNSSGTYCGLQ